ncbi:hypothetical protein SAMN02745146_3175 [Hymenobacter daecheongensis DSM 21074]|uniref:Uncharacterized protein n=1 Tax=Hymenobacter daecheongensis DSM 21074 TaxID=1121955 RepID=A0A1M6JKL1_9BACT|nr:hypothetical protein [Hymenobacter daecheongensis]SHJ47227.1 hypothetical protein SAMN02745146_3175 [Hymenobacter daecheongensis DSM 21074]
MHNIDRTLQELESPLAGEFENEYEYGAQGEYGQELELGQEFSGETYETSQQEQQELEMAYQLLEVSTEQELSQFLSSLISKATGAASRFVASPAGRGVGQYLVDFGKKTLPQLAGQYGGQAGGSAGGRLGAAIGGRFGATGARLGNWAGQKAGSWAGTQAGDWLAGNAQRIFNLELEALSPENQELEIAQSFVRFATDVAKRASQAVQQNPGISLGQLGQQVLNASAARHAPGLLRGGLKPAAPTAARPRANSGTWVRRGNALVILNA